MTKKVFKYLSFWLVIFLFSGVLSSLLRFTLKQWLLMIGVMSLATFGVVWVANFWESRQKQELKAMENRMVSTVAGGVPRGVLAEPDSPYYDLIRQFNDMQNFVQQAQQTAQRDVTNYRSLLASLPVGVININRAHTIDVFNETAAALLGIQRPETPISEGLVIRQFTLSELITQTFNSQKNQQSILNLQINGEMKQYEVSTLYHQGDLKHAEVMIIIYDLTSVLQVERMQSDFLANASHELKTPLTAITGFIETLQGQAGEDRATREMFLDIVAQEAKRLSSLVNDILSLSRVQQKREAVHTELAIHDMVTEQWQHVMPLATTKSVTLRNDVADDFMIRGLKTDVDMILQNLIGNAVKYNVFGGDIHVTAYKDHQHWQLNVKDTGIGIPTNQQTRIFERFYRGDESRQRKIASGTGLGLAIVNEIVNKHNGEIKVQSQVAVGTTVSVTLPL
ncbi:sensor histidine kinase [Leuconostoc holzapfelii]|uniref:histidine kinase n=1 Tax=Leuconostoc holzapfelii TaxID=434464 RepID=A0A846ZF21_9LACO|nr:ATP-binding protein [Leuconostoc holzapfelii]NKZ18199.1 histidine kinase [Leuconostoc holzapfelii]